MKEYIANRIEEEEEAFKEDEIIERKKLQFKIEGSTNSVDPEEKVREYLEQNSEHNVQTVQEASVYPELAKARRKLQKSKKDAEKYKRSRHLGSARSTRKKLSRKTIKKRKNRANEIEIENAIGSSSEFSNVEDFAYNPVRPDSSTSPFDLDSDDIHPKEKHLFDKMAEVDRKFKIEPKQTKKPKGSDETTSTETESSIKIPKRIYAINRTRTGARKDPPTSPIKPLSPILKKPQFQRLYSSSDDSTSTVRKVTRSSKMDDEEGYERDAPYHLFCDSLKTYNKMVGVIPNRNKKLDPVWLRPTKKVVQNKLETPTLVKSEIPKLPKIKKVCNYKTGDEYASSLSNNSLWSYNKRPSMMSRAANTKPEPMKGIHPPWAGKPQPIWINPSEQPKDQPSYLGIPQDDGTLQYWRPRQSAAWLFNQEKCTSAEEGEGDRIRDPEARYSCEPTEDYWDSDWPLPPYMTHVHRSENQELDPEIRKKNRQIEMAQRFEAQRKVVQFVAPTANLNIEYPNVKPSQIVLGPDDILAKVSYFQSNFGDLKHLASTEEFKGHLIVRIVRLGPGGQFQEGLEPGVLAWARYGKGQRLKARFMADNVDFFIFQLEHLSYYFDDRMEPNPTFPPICVPQTFKPS